MFFRFADPAEHCDASQSNDSILRKPVVPISHDHWMPKSSDRTNYSMSLSITRKPFCSCAAGGRLAARNSNGVGR